MKLGSLFDGSGGFPLAGALCGITPAFASEVEPYPIAVTTSRIPTMKHLGSVTDINGAEIEPVDIITFGSPCQDLSVAGKRAGLKHEANGDEETTRSGLFMEAVRIIKEMRRATNGLYPTFAVWENVPGAFSSNRGEDFRIVLEELIKIVEPGAVMPTVPQKGWAYADSYCGDGWSLAYRTLDAQYWGVPQRRRRIYLVLDLRGERAHKVLFEREGLRGYFTEGRAPWKATARNAENCPGADDSAGISDVIPINTMIATRHKQLGRGTGFGVGEAGEPQFTISAGHEHAVAFVQVGNGVNCLNPWDSQTIRQYAVDGVFPALPANSGGGQNRAGIVQPIAFAQNQRDEVRDLGDKAGALQAEPGMKQQTFIAQPTAYSFDSLATNSMKSKNPYSGCRMVEVAKTLDTTDPNPCKNQGGIAIVEQHLFENHSQDTRYRGPLDVAPIVSATFGMGGNNQPFVVENTTPIHDQPVYCLQGNGIDRADTAGCNGKGVKEDICYTLNTIDRPAVCYAETYQKVTGPLMANSHPGSYCGQDAYQDMLVVGKVREAEETPIVLDRAFFNQGQNAQYDPQFYTDGTVPTLVARDPSAVAHKAEIRYIVRRLTPTECARLQGFPDTWGHINPKENLTDEEYSFWLEVRNTHAAINGKATKEYTKEQMLTWYSKLHTDSAEYKMWGNGIALPTALYVMPGIADALE